MGSTVTDELSHVTVEDCQVSTSADFEDQQSGESSNSQSQAWADFKEEYSVSGTVGSEKPQETSNTEEVKTKAKIKVGPTAYCSYCQVDSHTEEQCAKVSSAKQTTKRKLSRRDSKPGKGESLGKKRRNFQSFKSWY